ncbi:MULTISPECIES: hypothetical protein [unclassified Bradyrhizobium]|uniref:hypothetical protein n=2 Tax=Bradyrhizobium TaxID=374 RepID=UPI001FF7E34A|nr:MULTISPECIES: hypothetical protein [unclassified Bradyrhizobium]
MAQAVAVVVHGLATNAAKDGSLSAPGGKVEVRWMTDDAGRMVLLWSESGGPRVTERARKGFGVGAIDGIIRTLGGKVVRRWKPEGLECEIRLPPAGAQPALLRGRRFPHLRIW